MNVALDKRAFAFSSVSVEITDPSFRYRAGKLSRKRSRITGSHVKSDTGIIIVSNPSQLHDDRRIHGLNKNSRKSERQLENHESGN